MNMRAILLAAVLALVAASPASGQTFRTHSVNRVVSPGHRARVEAVVGRYDRCSLFVLYAGGGTQRVRGPHEGIARAYDWRVPLDAGRGTAHVNVVCALDPFVGTARFWVRG